MNIEFVYTVQSGDTLSSIAESVRACAGVTVNQLEKANPNLEPSALQVGAQIIIPHISEGGYLHYTIRSGDSLSRLCQQLAQCNTLTVSDIEAANTSVAADNIQIGELINIPAASKAQSSEVVLSPVADVMGYWHWTYSHANSPANATLSLAFSGFADVNEAISNAKRVKSNLTGDAFVCFGGGNAAGAFNVDVLKGIQSAISQGVINGYQGVAFDIEIGDSGLSSKFRDVFLAAKAAGLKVLVTISHSAPYDISDASTLMSMLLTDENIDYISPQLYTTGQEPANDYATSHGVAWEEYAQCKAAIVPSIVKDTYYPSAQHYFAQCGVTLAGYIQWQQTH